MQGKNSSAFYSAEKMAAPLHDRHFLIKSVLMGERKKKGGGGRDRSDDHSMIPSPSARAGNIPEQYKKEQSPKAGCSFCISRFI